MIPAIHLQRHKIPAGLLVCILLLSILTPQAIQAQTPQESNPLHLLELDTREFPTLRLRFRLNQAMPDNSELESTALKIFENDQPTPSGELRSEEAGIHFILAINPDLTLSLRDEMGVSRLDKVSKLITSWGKTLKPHEDDRFSLFINPDTLLESSNNVSVWLNSLNTYHADTRSMSPSLASLSVAVSSLEASPPSTDTVLLYVCPYIGPSEYPAFESLIERAGQAGANVHVWIGMNPEMAGSVYEEKLAALVASNGGKLKSLNAPLNIEDVQNLTKGLGKAYTLSYRSSVRQSGKQTLRLEYDVDGRKMGEGQLQYQISITPAKLSLIQVPAELHLQADAEGKVSPTSLNLSVLIEFPDGYPRAIQKTTLWVNGVKTLSNEAAPFGNFTLPLQEYLKAEQLRLQVSLVDELGIEGRSKSQIILLQNPQTGEVTSKALSPLFLVLIFLLLLIGGLVFMLFYRRKTKKAEVAEEKPKAELPEAALGSLVRLDENLQAFAEKPLALTNALTLIGRDPERANLVIDHPSLEAIHAELHFYPDGRIVVRDFFSTAGSDVNGQKVAVDGSALEHGDILRLGELSFRLNTRIRLKKRG